MHRLDLQRRIQSLFRLREVPPPFYRFVALVKVVPPSPAASTLTMLSPQKAALRISRSALLSLRLPRCRAPRHLDLLKRRDTLDLTKDA